MKCSACGKENPEEQLYCGHCGALIPVGETPEAPYFSVTGLGITTTFTRPAFNAYYGFLAVMWVVFIIIAFVGSYLTGDTEGVVIGIVMLLLSPVLYGIVECRLRANRRQMGKKKGI